MEETGPRIYRADNRFDCGWFGAVAALYRELRAYRTHIATLFLKDFHAAYRGTKLGVFWNFALPLLPITAYTVLALVRVFPTRDGIPAALFIASGATVWFLMSELISKPMVIVRARSREVMKTALPLSASIASSFAMLAFETLVRVVFFVILAVVYRTMPVPTAPLALLILLAACTFSISLGIILSILNAVSPDVERVVTIFLRYAIFLSGVIFPLSAAPALAPLEIYNPFAVFIYAVREAFFFGSFQSPAALITWSVAGLALALVAARLFYIMEYRIRGVA